MDPVPPFSEAAFSEKEHLDRLRRFREVLNEQNIDAALVHNPEDIYYLCGNNAFGYYNYQHLLVSADDSLLTLFCRMVDTVIARATCIPSTEIVSWADRDDAIVHDAALIREKGLADGRLGIQESSRYLRVSEFSALKKELLQASFEDISDAAARLRLIKSPLEQDYVRKSAELADSGLKAGLEAIIEGAKECDVAAAVYEAMFRAGCETMTWPLPVMSGSRSCFLHGGPTERRMQKGDVVVFEPMGCYRRYNVQALRTAVIGKANEKLRDVHAAARESVEACQEMVKPGVLAEEVDALSRKITARYDRYRLHRTGYSLEPGYPLQFVGAMSLVEGDKTILEPGMVFSIEPNITLFDEGWGVELGNCVLVTENGCEVLHKTPLDLIEK